MAYVIADRYEVLTKVREGGMGTVFRVRDVTTGQVRVLKAMRAQIAHEPVARERFLREAKLARSLDHPNIAVLTDILGEGGQDEVAMVLEFVDGPSMSEFLGLGGPPPIDITLDLSIQTLLALDYLHKRGIVHRDVSPENLLLTLTPQGRVVVKLIDFGIAKVAEETTMTMTGMFVGKVRYSSPEQLGALKEGEAIDGRSDVYAYGCVLYLLLTGKLPYDAESPQAWAMAHLMRPPRPFEETDPEGRVPPRLRAIVLRALAKDRADRWPTAAAFADALGALRGSETAVRRAAATDGAERVRRFRRDRDAAAAGVPVPTREEDLARERRERRRALVAVGGAAALLLGGGITLAILQPWKKPPPPPPPVRADGTLVLTSTPWARVVSAVDEEVGRPVTLAQTTTPLRVTLPAGRYRITLAGGVPGSGQTTVAADVPGGRERPIHVDLPGFDMEKAIRTLAP